MFIWLNNLAVAKEAVNTPVSSIFTSESFRPFEENIT